MTGLLSPPSVTTLTSTLTPTVASPASTVSSATLQVPGGRPSVPQSGRRGTNLAVSKRTRFALQVQKPTGDTEGSFPGPASADLPPSDQITGKPSGRGGELRKPRSPGGRGRGRGRGREVGREVGREETLTPVQQPEFNKARSAVEPALAVEAAQACSPITLEYAEELLSMAALGSCNVMDVLQIPKECPSGQTLINFK